MQSLSSVSQGTSMSHSDDLYALTNWPCLMMLPRGEVQLDLVVCVWLTVGWAETTGWLVVPATVVGLSVSLAFPPALLGSPGWTKGSMIFSL